jgi:hypothetical protein
MEKIEEKCKNLAPNDLLTRNLRLKTRALFELGQNDLSLQYLLKLKKAELAEALDLTLLERNQIAERLFPRIKFDRPAGLNNVFANQASQQEESKSAFKSASAFESLMGSQKQEKKIEFHDAIRPKEKQKTAEIKTECVELRKQSNMDNRFLLQNENRFNKIKARGRVYIPAYFELILG